MSKHSLNEKLDENEGYIAGPLEEPAPSFQNRKAFAAEAQAYRKSSAVGRPLTKARLIADFSKTLKLSRKQCAALFDLLAEVAISEVMRTGKFGLPGIGRLVTIERRLRLGRSPQTGQEIKIKTSKLIRLRVSKVASDQITETCRK